MKWNEVIDYSGNLERFDLNNAKELEWYVRIHLTESHPDAKYILTKIIPSTINTAMVSAIVVSGVHIVYKYNFANTSKLKYNMCILQEDFEDED